MARKLPVLQRVAIWGCGNFELNWPGYLFVSGQALRGNRLDVSPWTERLAPSGVKRWGGVTRDDWRDRFQNFALGLSGADVRLGGPRSRDITRASHRGEARRVGGVGHRDPTC